MPMTSTYTAAERRKKAVTYGKPGRYAATTTTQLFDDAPSPERPRKQAGSVFATVQKTGASLGVRNTLSSDRVKSSVAPTDVFDVPSDTEPTPRAPAVVVPRKKTPAVLQDVDMFDFPASGDERPKTAKKVGKRVAPTRKAGVTRPPVSANAQGRNRAAAPSSEDPLAAPPLPAARRRVKPPQIVSKTASVKQSQLERLESKSLHLDIFDVPSSDEDAPAKTPTRPKPAPLFQPKVAPVPPAAQVPPSPSPSVDSDVSNTSNKRKRRAAVSSSATAKGTVASGKKREASIPPRNKKYQRKENSLSPGHDVMEVPAIAAPRIAKVPGEPTINKPKRTWLRTAAAPPRVPFQKGQSSPAKLHAMLADRSKSRSKPTVTAAPVLPKAPVEDETMYEPQETVTPRAGSKNMTVPGSVTPTQQALFSHLLDDSSDSATPMPSMSALKLTGRRSGSTIASLLRSSSDIPQSAHTRKGRLIDTLKQATSSSDEESESDEETEEEIVDIPNVSSPVKTIMKDGVDSRIASQDTPDTMDIDSEPPANSQTSQTAVSLHSGGKVTYAKQRSYLEERGDNIEDILDMVLDDNIGFGPQHQESLSEDEEMIGMQGVHHLRNTGQQQKFHTEVESAIDDIAGRGGLNSSQRRSAMMDFATHLANKNYVGQLLESFLTSRLLRSISSSGEIIFDFAAAVAVLFILDARPGAAILEEVYQSPIFGTLNKLLASNFASLDIHRISKDRKTNTAPKARETIAEFRSLILNSAVWTAEKPEKVSPQLLATKVLEILVVSLRQTGNTEALADESLVTRIVDVASGPCQRLKTGKAIAQDHLLLDTSLSALESLSVSKETQATWSNELLSRLADMIPAVFEASDHASPIRLAIRLCINLTNDKPRACQIFAKPSFVVPLLRSISHNFKLLVSAVDTWRRTEVNEDLIFSLGAMINLAECSEQARASANQNDDDVIGGLVQIFLEGSERADQADSMEESQSIVPIGYLTILLGNLCQDPAVRKKVGSKLPRGKIDMLVQKIREFVQYNQRVDRLAGKYRGKEGEEVHRNFTERLELVVERLERAGK